MIKRSIVACLFNVSVLGCQLNPARSLPLEDEKSEDDRSDTMDALMAKLDLDFCDGSKACWSKLTTKLGIQPCDIPGGGSIATENAFSVLSGIDSGIVTSDKGRRLLFDRKLSGYRFRFSYDESDGLCGYEVFVKTPDNFIYALAVDSGGVFLREVPDRLANDKHGNKADGSGSVITSEQGCFSCHPQVSSDYSIAGADGFWSGIDRDRLIQIFDSSKITSIKDPPL